MRTVLVRDRGWIDPGYALLSNLCTYRRNTLVSIDPTTRFVVITIGEYRVDSGLIAKLPHPMGYYYTMCHQAKFDDTLQLYICDSFKPIRIPGQKFCVNVRSSYDLPKLRNKAIDEMHDNYVDALIAHYDFILGERK